MKRPSTIDDTKPTRPEIFCFKLFWIGWIAIFAILLIFGVLKIFGVLMRPL